MFPNPYLTTAKTIAFTRQTFVAKVMSLLFSFYFYYKLIYFNGRLITLYIVLVLPYINMNLHRCTCVPHPVPPSHLPPPTIPLGYPCAPSPSIGYHESNLDWQFVSYMILYMFQCHSPKSPHPLPQSLCFVICCLG